MKIRPGPLVSILLLFGLAGYVYVYEIRGKAAEQKSTEGKDRAIPFERAALQSIRIQNENGPVRLEKSGDAWKITEPLSTDADKDAVEGLVSSLELARVDRRLKAGEDRKQYGLDPPKTTLSLETTAPAGTRTLSLGDGSPIGGSFYALLPGSDQVAVVSASLGDLARKDLLTLRDKTVLLLDPWKVKRLALERGKETIRMEKPDDGWVVRQPIETPADGPTISDILNALQNLRATSFASEKPADADLRKFGLLSPAARMTLLQEGWDVEKTVSFGAEAPGGGRYARTQGRDPVVVVPADFWAKVTTKFFDLRRKDLLGVQQYRVESITLVREAGKGMTLKKDKDQSWSLGGSAQGKVKADSADTLLRMVSDLKATSFNDAPGATILSALAHVPALDLTIEEEADETTGRQKTQHLLISRPDHAGHVLVRDMAWHPVAVVDAGVLEKIDKQIDAVVKEAAETAKSAASPSPAPVPPAAPSPSPVPK